jgi:ubiquinone/menaquinone biosynthesis C-methylase UbiE
MGFYQTYVVPRLTHWAMSNRELAIYRRRTIPMARGRVLEIGIGSGINLSLYGREASAVYGIDPSAALLKRAAGHQGIKPFLTQGSDEELPFEPETFDTIVTTWTLCSIPDALGALRERGRVLHRDGRLLFAEHGLAPEEGIARWQNRLTPCWRRLGGGCHLNRKIDDLIAGAGFQIEELDKGYLRGPNPFSYMYEGTARFLQ